ncbi:catalase [Sporosarcina sp. Marseille-Q4063]|uniref:catalase n=1 Tax=Sporosarcina sp. Marseille-Q4063 TaxID=2810514 RepID=UPI001BB0B320|nr:catalase [Sporosarcina sp. Marseille-Q4063]QUW23692.1 catalase [Sporosarcina sp. Marseille-Q4063]
MTENRNVNETSKDEQLETFRSYDKDEKLTTNQGLRVSEDEHSLKSGVRGPTLLEDFHLREKIMHFDHERIPERVVHARGYAAHGEFELYESMKDYTKAKFLQEPGSKVPVFTRFSAVTGNRGSANTVRDVRGFAVKFYTEEGNYDLVGNNMPVFHIQDAIKFPDLIHAVKPEPHNEMPQAASAHDTFWDFVANNQESAHMVMWHMSDRAIPRSYRMMEGFGVHTFRLVNEEGKAHFVKFHWKPKLGVHSLVWDEAQKLNGKDPDFHRRDLWDSINQGNFAEFDLGVQLIEEKDEFMFDFDILDPTKIWPEEQIPVKLIGKMTLNRNVDNVFAETEQVAFHPGNVVPGIDFTNDPLLQGRLFSYTDTQLIRLGGPNFHELPINRPVCPFHNNQRDGYGRQTINVGQVSYHKNSLADNTPETSTEDEGGYVHYQEKIDGRKIQARSDSFKDHFSQARLFWNSMTPPEKQHIIDAFSFEVGKVKNKDVKQQVVDMFANVERAFATTIADAVGVNPPAAVEESKVTETSPALSQEATAKLPNTRKIAVLIGNNFDEDEVKSVVDALLGAGMIVDIVSEKLGEVHSNDQLTIEVNETFLTVHSVLYDGLYVVGGEANNPKKFKNDMADFINEAFRHYKPIGIATTAKQIFSSSEAEPGIVVADETDNFNEDFIAAVAAHRHWNREIVK